MKIYRVTIHELFESDTFSYCETLEVAKKQCYKAHEFVAGRFDEDDIKDYTVNECEDDYGNFYLDCEHKNGFGHSIHITEIELFSE